MARESVLKLGLWTKDGMDVLSDSFPCGNRGWIKLEH